MRIEIICTGDEVLTGKTVNTNYSHMARRLREVGLDVLWGTTVGDDREGLLSAFRLAAGRADAVVVNGGLGPTVDDLSQEVAAEAAKIAHQYSTRSLTESEMADGPRGYDGYESTELAADGMAVLCATIPSMVSHQVPKFVPA